MTTDRIRTTISLDPEVHEIFKHMAEASGMSVSRCMGEWLADTAEGAQLVLQKMMEAKRAPLRVMRQFQAISGTLSTDIQETIAHLEKKQAGAAGSRSAQARRPASPPRKAPSSNTGLKSPGKGRRNP